ncbi:universal stress protein [Halomarina salina]|uniref:Universal stress protein n=1 Tax=Halomarina salina TaxID=1872699 RepID=A0ABD5RQD6_9EURY|nr:universal stress protein [Halomarina salina]
MFEEILLALDGSDCAETAAAAALTLAERSGGRIHAVGVVEVYELSTTRERDAREQEAKERLSAFADRAAEAGVDCETDLRSGFADEELLGAIDDHGADLVVLGTHGRTGARRFLVGSVAARVARRSPVPVLTTPATDDAWSVETVLLPTDGSEHAAAATHVGIEAAADLGGSVHVLSAVEDDALGLDVRSSKVLEAQTRVAESAVDEAVASAESSGVEATSEVVSGRPHRTILDAVEAHDADLVVMGTHGRSGVSRILLGSVAEKVVRGASVPVLTVPVGE